MRDLFDELNGLFRDLRPPIRPGFNPPADPIALDAAEIALGLEIPRDLRELLACADGQAFPPTDQPDPIFPCFRFRPGPLGRTIPSWLASTARIAKLALLHRESYPDFADEPFEVFGPASYHDRYIPFTDSESAAALCLDMAPEPGGSVGQVVMAADQPCQVVVLAPDLRSFLRRVIDGFREGRFRLEREGYCVWTEPE